MTAGPAWYLRVGWGGRTQVVVGVARRVPVAVPERRFWALFRCRRASRSWTRKQGGRHLRVQRAWAKNRKIRAAPGAGLDPRTCTTTATPASRPSASGRPSRLASRAAALHLDPAGWPGAADGNPRAGLPGESPCGPGTTARALLSNRHLHGQTRRPRIVTAALQDLTDTNPSTTPRRCHAYHKDPRRSPAWCPRHRGRKSC